MSLKGKSAVVTGSTSGIGEGIARALAAAGADVMLNGFGDAGEIEALRAGIEREHGVRCRHSDADLSRGAAAKGLVAEVEEAFGAVDILVNNAGVQTVERVEDFPEDRWELILALNLSANFYTIKAAVPGMKRRGYGRIVNIASAHGLVASPFKAAYVAAKHGVLGLTKTVALELAETGVTCNAICPGFVKTPLVEGQIAEQAKANDMTEDQVVRDVILASQPSKRFVGVDEVAAMTVFLCGETAASITGVPLSIDGGWTAR